MATLSDAQINMAITQMEAVANNPSQLKMAADQMKDMSESELRQAVDQSPLVSNNSNNVSKSQFQQATQQMSSMSPTQLRQQAQMLKSMPLDTLRKTNPQMANMTDEQIQMSIAQLEQMAENPEMVKMAADQMKNMTAEQYESMKNMMGGGLNNNGSLSNAGSNNTAAAGMGAGLPTDPSKMLEALLSSPEQLNSIVKTMKQNPEMMKQMMGSAMGGGGEGNKDSDAGGGNDARREQMEKAIDSFSEMDEKKLERYLKVANTVQSVAKPVLTVFDKLKRTLGVSTKTLAVLINLMFFVGFVLLVRWWRMRNGGGGGIEMGNATITPPEIISESYEESEFWAAYDGDMQIMVVFIHSMAVLPIDGARPRGFQNSMDRLDWIW